MKKFAILIYTDAALLDALPPAEFDTTMRGCIEHADHLRDDGVLLDARMLQPAAGARSIRVRDGRSTVVDGPFAETKEMLAGFNIVEAADLAEAERIAASFPWSRYGCIEVREILEVDEMRARVGAPLPTP